MRSRSEARTRTFARRKIFIVSTPTIAGASAIEREYEAVRPAPLLRALPALLAPAVAALRATALGEGRPETAAYVCESCETAIAEHHKTWMLEHGEWRATAEGRARRRGFICRRCTARWAGAPGARSPRAWEAAVSQEPDRRADQDLQEHRARRDLGRGGRGAGLAAPAGAARGLPIGTVPAGGLLLTAGADVQKDRIEVSVWAFGRGKEAWLVEHRVLMGDTARDAVWQRAGRDCSPRPGPTPRARRMPLARLALDTGFATQEAYAFVRACRDARVMAVKGVRPVRWGAQP
ncbi:MAG: hypothetical protein KatS3mg122_2124 [Caldimonas sp.]|nr:MAG: hypothetical protein KatS3mg122_2124 [Caldimonas sp.]